MDTSRFRPRRILSLIRFICSCSSFSESCPEEIPVGEEDLELVLLLVVLFVLLVL